MSDEEKRSIVETAKEIGQTVVKKAPSILKASLRIVGNGAGALGDLLHKMSDMISDQEDK